MLCCLRTGAASLRDWRDRQTRQCLASLLSTALKKDLLNYDVIVAGLGSVGCAALYHLAKAQCKVLGIEKQGRVASPRFPYSALTFHHPVHYYDLLQRSLTLWKRIESEVERKLLLETGSLYCGVHYDALYEAVESFGLDHEELRGIAVPMHFPQLWLPMKEDVLLVDLGAVMHNDRATDALFHLANEHGAKFRFRESVLKWTANATEVTVVTNKCVYTAKKLILACGHSIGSLVPELKKVYRTSISSMASYRLKRMYQAVSAPPIPVLQYDESTGNRLLMWSSLDELNVCMVTEVMSDAARRKKASRQKRSTETAQGRQLRKLCPGVLSTKPILVKRESVSVIRDGDFILDRHPKASQVILGLPSGDLGHVCASALGEVLSLMAREKDGDITSLLEPFRLHRAAIQQNLLKFH